MHLPRRQCVSADRFSEKKCPVIQSTNSAPARSGRRNSSSLDVAALSELSEILERQLRRSPHADLRSVCVDVEDGLVRLRGRVRSFHAKQLAHIIVRDEFHRGRVENAIDVA